MAGDLTYANGVMRIVGGKLVKMYEEVPLLHNRMQKGSGTKISDRGIEIPTHLAGNFNHKFMTDGGEFPVGGANLVKRATAFFKNVAAATRLSGGAIDTVNSGDVAYIKNWLNFNLDETLKAFAKISNAHAYGDGSAKLATLSALANSTTQTVNNADANRYLHDGMVVDFIDTSNGAVLAAGKVIDNAQASSTTFTLTTAADTTASGGTCIVVPTGSYNLGIMGLRGIIDDTTNAPVIFQGISRNTYPSYRASRVDAGSVGLDVAFIRRLLGAGIHVKQGELNRKALELWTHMAQIAAMDSLGWTLKRFEGDSKSMDLGFTTHSFEGIPFVEDVDHPKSEIKAINWSTMKKYEAKGLGWDDKTGSILRQIPGTAAYTDMYEAYLTARYNYGCDKPNANGWIENLTITTGF
jgi:hypothetical protein